VGGRTKTIKTDKESPTMPDHTYKMLELVGTSSKSIEDAVQSALDRAAKTVRNMRWLEVKEVHGNIQNGKLAEWQVVMKIGFTLED
jgi:flavin-binding protein dodecin